MPASLSLHGRRKYFSFPPKRKTLLLYSLLDPGLLQLLIDYMEPHTIMALLRINSEFYAAKRFITLNLISLHLTPRCLGRYFVTPFAPRVNSLQVSIPPTVGDVLFFPEKLMLGLSNLIFKAYDGMNEYIMDFGNITMCNNLRSLTIDQRLKLSNLNVIPNYVSLRKLSIFDIANIPDLNAIGECSNIEELILFGCLKIKTIEPLSKLSKLEYLCLVNVPNVTSIEPLIQCSELEYLHLNEWLNLKDASPIM